MNLAALPYTGAEIVAALVGMVAARMVWRRKSSAGAPAMLVTLALGAWWCFWHGLSLMMPALPAKIALAWLWFPAAAGVSWSLLLFALQYVRQQRAWPLWGTLALAAVPLAQSCLVWTNGWHHLYWARTYLDTTAPFPLFGVDHGLAAVVSSSLNELVALIAIVLLGRVAAARRGLYRRQLTLFIAGVLVPLTANVLYAAGLTPYKNLDFTPLGLMAGIALIAWAMYVQRLLDIVPVAYRAIIEGIGDAVIVLDVQGRVVYLNLSARSLLGAGAAAIGQTLAGWPRLAALAALAGEEAEPGRASSELPWGEGPGQRLFDAAVSALHDRSGRQIGRAIVLRDVTHRRLVDHLRHSRAQIIAAEEHARQEIAEMLHGTVQAKLLNVWLRLGDFQDRWAADPEQARELAEIRETLDALSSQDVRRASHLLHPAVIKFGLAPAVQELADSFARFFQVDLSADPALRQADDPVRPSIDEASRLVAYRVVEEGLTNAAKHARAQHVTVRLKLMEDRLLDIVVQDDGQGFDAGRLQPGLGLEGILGRLEQHGGTCQIDSQPGRGTRLHAVLPLEAGPPGSSVGSALPPGDSLARGEKNAPSGRGRKARPLGRST